MERKGGIQRDSERPTPKPPVYKGSHAASKDLTMALTFYYNRSMGNLPYNLEDFHSEVEYINDPKGSILYNVQLCNLWDDINNSNQEKIELKYQSVECNPEEEFYSNQ